MNNRFAQIEEMLISDPNDPFLWFAKAKELEKLNQADMALEAYSYLVKNHTNYIGTYYHYGQLLISASQQKAAAKIIRKGIEEAKLVGDHHATGELSSLLIQIDEEE